MNAKIHELLREYGLKDVEIKIYLYLVGNKELTAYRIAKGTNIHRSTTYDILERLISKGFVNKIEKNQILFYSSNEVSKIAAGLKDKETLLLSLIPELEKVEKDETKIRFLEGVENRKHFNYNLFSLAKNKKFSFCYMISGTESATTGTNNLMDRLLAEFVKKGFHKNFVYKGIWDLSFRSKEILKRYEKVGQNKFLKLPSKSTTLIYGDYVCFLFTTDKPYTIEIKNKFVANEMLAYFNHLWEIAKV